MKCIDLISIKEEEEEKSSKYDVLAIGASGGRFDHIMSNIHYLYKLKDERKIYLLSEKNLIFLLDKVSTTSIYQYSIYQHIFQKKFDIMIKFYFTIIMREHDIILI